MTRSGGGSGGGRPSGRHLPDQSQPKPGRRDPQDSPLCGGFARRAQRAPPDLHRRTPDDGGPWVPVSHPEQVGRAWRARGSRPDSHRGSRAAREAAWETGPADAAANAVRPPGDVRAVSGPPGGQLDLFSQGTVADYLFARDVIFAQLNLNPDEFGLYQQIYQLLDRQLPRPDLVVYLEARPEVLLRHLRKRDRDYERGITPEYLGRLTEAFRNFFHHYTEAPLLVVNCSDIDFVDHGGDLADLIKEIRGMRQGVQHYIPLGSR